MRFPHRPYAWLAQINHFLAQSGLKLSHPGLRFIHPKAIGEGIPNSHPINRWLHLGIPKTWPAQSQIRRLNMISGFAHQIHGGINIGLEHLTQLGIMIKHLAALGHGIPHLQGQLQVRGQQAGHQPK